jgi:hypothetical protein
MRGFVILWVVDAVIVAAFTARFLICFTWPVSLLKIAFAVALLVYFAVLWIVPGAVPDITNAGDTFTSGFNFIFAMAMLYGGVGFCVGWIVGILIAMYQHTIRTNAIRRG